MRSSLALGFIVAMVAEACAAESSAWPPGTERVRSVRLDVRIESDRAWTHLDWTDSNMPSPEIVDLAAVPEPRVHDARDLLMPGLFQIREDEACAWFSRFVSPRLSGRSLDADWLVRFVRASLPGASWELPNTIQIASGCLVVANTPEVQEGVARVLAHVRESIGREQEIALPIPAEAPLAWCGVSDAWGSLFPASDRVSELRVEPVVGPDRVLRYSHLERPDYRRVRVVYSENLERGAAVFRYRLPALLDRTADRITIDCQITLDRPALSIECKPAGLFEIAWCGPDRIALVAELASPPAASPPEVTWVVNR